MSYLCFNPCSKHSAVSLLMLVLHRKPSIVESDEYHLYEADEVSSACCKVPPIVRFPSENCQQKTSLLLPVYAQKFVNLISSFISSEFRNAVIWECIRRWKLARKWCLYSLRILKRVHILEETR